MKRDVFLAILLLVGWQVFGQYGAEVPFTVPLPIPPLLEDLNPDPDRAQLELIARPGSRVFLPGTRTQTYGYNGDYLGPTIKVRRDEEVSIKVSNQLDEVTTVHWHGLHIPGEMDGGPRQVIRPQEVWNPHFTINQPAATLWYHPHALGRAGEHVYRGLAGLFIIEDEISDELDIPKTYGVDDIPLIIQDKRFHRDGSFGYIEGRPDIMHGVIGDTVLANGAVQPFLNVATIKIRFRVLNGSTSSIYRLFLADRRPFHQIASDGGFLEEPVKLRSLLLSAGERAEIVVDFSAYNVGDSVILKVVEAQGKSFEVMNFVVAEQQSDRSELPPQLTTIEPIPETQAAKIRRFVLDTTGDGRQLMSAENRLTINGKKMNIDRIDETVRLGDTEIWEITNRSRGIVDLPHSFHLHDVQFQILDINGQRPPRNQRGWKDTVMIPTDTTVRIIAVFEDYTGIYMYHCHLLEHEDDGMMGQFEVRVP